MGVRALSGERAQSLPVGVVRRMSIWSTPRNPLGHARELVRKADGRVMEGDGHGG